MGCNCGNSKQINRSLAKIIDMAKKTYKWVDGINQNSTVTHLRHRYNVWECTPETLQSLYTSGCSLVEVVQKEANKEVNVKKTK